jgi:putative peptidoglycan lipid II flippase
MVVAMTRPGDRSMPAPTAADPDATAVSPAVGQSPLTGQAFDAVEQSAGPAPGADPPPQAIPGPESGSVARNSAVMAAGSIVSRITGLLRTTAIVAVVGAGLVGDDYQLAITLPTMVFELLVGGVLSSVIVPVLVRSRKNDPDAGQAYAQRLLSLAAIWLGIATALAVAAAPIFTEILTTERVSRADQDLITKLSYLILPAIFFYGMAALFGALLNARGHFAAPMWTPILNNIVVIATAGVFILISTGRPSPESITTSQLLVLGLGTTTGIVVQAAGLWPALRRVGFRWRWRFDFRALGLGELGRLAVWMLLFVVVSQVGVFVVLKVAKQAGTEGAAGVVIFQVAFLLFMMAHGIVAVSVMTALMPRLSAAAADGRHHDLVAQLSSGLRLVSVMLVPIMAAYVVLGRPIAVTLFEYGHVSHAEALSMAPVIAVAGLGLVPYAILQLQQFAFYAVRDTRTPALINIPLVAARITLALVAVEVLAATSVAVALMGGSAVSYIGGVVLSSLLLRRRIGRLGLRRVAVTLAKIVGAAAIAAVPAILLGNWITGEFGDTKLINALELIACGAVLLSGYIGAALLLRVPEVRELALMVRRRLVRAR